MQLPNLNSFKVITIVAAALPSFASAKHVPFNGNKFQLSRMAPETGLEKRFDNTRFTFYDITAGPTACGNSYSPSDFVVALDVSQFGDGSYPGPNCFKEIVISANGKTTNAQIVDECMGCPFGGLDLTKGLFEFFGDSNVGVITGSWNFV